MDNIGVIALCLFLMGCVGFVSVAYGADIYVSSVVDNPNVNAVLYDELGSPVCYYNWTAVAGQGVGYPEVYERSVRFSELVVWTNVTGSFFLFWDDLGADPVSFGSVSDANGNFQSAVPEYWRDFTYADSSFWASLYVNVLLGGLTASVVSVVATGFVLAFSVMGSGVSEAGAKMITTTMLFGLLWALVSAPSVGMVTAIPFFGWIFYLVMSFAYFLGVWGIINGN